MIIDSTKQCDRQQTIDFYQESYEKGFDDGQFMWPSSHSYRDNISYLSGYIAGMKERIWKIQNPASAIDPECGF